MLSLSALLSAPHTTDFCPFPKSRVPHPAKVCSHMHSSCSVCLYSSFRVLLKDIPPSPTTQLDKVPALNFLGTLYFPFWCNFNALHSCMIIWLGSVFSIVFVTRAGAIYKDRTYCLVFLFVQNIFIQWMMRNYTLCNRKRTFGEY